MLWQKMLWHYTSYHISQQNKGPEGENIHFPCIVMGPVEMRVLYNVLYMTRVQRETAVHTLAIR